jgi:predicted transcriptional regulator
MLGVRLSDELESKLEKYIKTNRMTKSQFVKQAVSLFLKQQELKDMHDEMTMRGLDEIDKGQGIPGNMVFDMLSKWSRNG